MSQSIKMTPTRPVELQGFTIATTFILVTKH